ncbi:MAG: flagellar hook-length control protein FliK [Parvibaculum sp.]|uniref:flagellar hook-length control protein FliK n=1 Tax=Parvibaculum sp. TaxID=2024848 RepID=UPI002ABD0C14|nr:flagellar hook-length control protein FliK [Parvibaculum sp.]MDZ4380157.1 flagellar hook-length control protein FliK [Parvibaculum sp.]
MEFSSPATQRSSSASESLLIQPGSVRSPAADAATDFARHLAESSKQRSDRRDERPIERHERSATSGHRDAPAVRETSREDRDRESRKAGAGESSPATPARVPAPEPQIDSSGETVAEDTTVAAGETAKADGNEQVPAEDDTDTTVDEEAEDIVAAAAIPTTETAPVKTPETSALPLAPAAIDGSGDTGPQQAAAPAGKESLEGQPAPAAQSAEEAPSATDIGKTQSRTAAQAPSGAQTATQASPASGTAEEQLAAAGTETAETKPEKAEKGLGQEAAEKLAERKSGAAQTASQTSAAAAPAAGQQATRAASLASQIAQGTSAIANTGPSTGSGDMPVSTVQQPANAGGNAATVRIGTLPGQSQPTQLPANAIALQMARNLQKGISRFDIRLDPPEMGRVDVRMEVRKDGHVVAHMTVDRPETLDLLQRDARALQQALNNAGLQADSDSLNFSLRDQNDNSGGRDFAAGGNANASDDADVEMPLTQIYNVNLAANGGVDIRI